MIKSTTPATNAKGQKHFRSLAALTLIIAFYLTAFTSLAQSAATVKGTVADAATQKPLDYVSVVLLHLPDSAVVASEMTDAAGAYVFMKVKSGKYVVKA
ncbi:carboxypeptidase regulatory-like domain-containing protein [Pontibacter silvestris]|uniref:Carboxypeptidase regulatory-like domain-containing protein n=1 Tax=Pontibacter silvestris TaxID=2305183 RepID=A0ABW4WW01_9BACT|nr:carboxypeptidase regulatory-like domain-containing protein [Pontibacter silvestris]MCC9137384.1 carboxypeptidase-like regulatory domain-containing protein [Pontibacter silvestris]